MEQSAIASKHRIFDEYFTVTVQIPAGRKLEDLLAAVRYGFLSDMENKLKRDGMPVRRVDCTVRLGLFRMYHELTCAQAEILREEGGLTRVALDQLLTYVKDCRSLFELARYIVYLDFPVQGADVEDHSELVPHVVTLQANNLSTSGSEILIYSQARSVKFGYHAWFIGRIPDKAAKL